MKKNEFLLSSLLFLTLISSFLSAKEIPYTLDDRDRLIRIETSLKEFKASVDKRFEAIDKRFEAIDKRFDQLINIFLGVVAAFAGIVAVTIGFAIWDRKTTLSPYLKRSRDIEEREEMIEKILKEYAKTEPKLAEVMKRLGVL